MSEPDFSSAHEGMEELVHLSAVHRFDLFEALRLLSQAGAPTFCCEIDDSTTIAAGRRIIRYQLSERLKALLSALRAENLNADEIERAVRFRSALSDLLKGLL